MKYEDFLTPTEQEYRIMRQRYMQEVERETGDLQEILQKMETQKEYLQRNNNDQKYNKIIDKLADNISELNSLIISSQSHFLFDAFRQVNVNLSKILGNFPHKKMRTTTHSPHLNKNRWHIAPPTEDNYILQSTTKESTILSEECQPKNVILHNQIDIIRLFLLYLMLKPNCKYLSSITTIANSQFDILLELM